MKFLVIQTRDIGDVMISTALCNTLKLNYPDAQVDMLTMSFSVGVVEGNPNINHIYILEHGQRNNLRYLLSLLTEIRQQHYDTIINAQGQLTGLLTCLSSLSSRRIGWNKAPWRWAQTDNAPEPIADDVSGECHTIDDRFRLLKPLNLGKIDRRYKIWLNDAELEHGRQLLRQSGIDTTRPVVALGVNSRDDFKQWPLEYFATVTDWLIGAFDVQIFAFFGPGEDTYTQSLKPKIEPSHHRQTFDQVKTQSIRELASCFAACDLYIGNDTGPRHIAQSLDVPAFAIVSPASDKYGWIPWSNPRFRAVDAGDALGKSKEEWQKITKNLTPGKDDEPWFRQLDPEFVISELEKMIQDLKLFGVN